MSRFMDAAVPRGASEESSHGASLSLNEVDAGYGRVQVLRGINLVMPAGQVTAVLGANGAGKTTLLRVASGLVRPTKGTIELGENAITSASPSERTRAGLCLVPEGRGVFRSLSVRENLRMFTPAGQREDFDRALEAFPVLGQRLGQTAGSMSGGQQQMLALSRALLVSPKVLLVDEVSMGLAPRVIDEIFGVLRDMASGGMTLVIVEQYVQRALKLADQVVVLDRGRLHQISPANEVDHESLAKTYLGGQVERADDPLDSPTP